jgi:hypothetical protein
MSSSSSAAVGAELVFSIGEPWNFRSADGDNVIHGRLVEIRTDGSWLVESDGVLCVDGVSGREMLVRPRYTGESLLNPLDETGVNVNVALFAQADELATDAGRCASPHFVLVGSVRLKTPA